MENVNFSELLLERLTEIQNGKISAAEERQVKISLMDYLSTCIAGAKILAQENHRYIDQMKAYGEYRVFGLEHRVNEYTSVLLNGINAHTTELDDGHRYGMTHIGAVIFSALLPISEKEDISSEMFIKGVIAGYEATVLTAMAMQPFHKEIGFHTTGTCGTIGAAAAISVALGYDDMQKKSALAAAATSAAGLLEIQEDGSQLKGYNAGRAALDGMIAASVGRLGLTAPNDVFGGKRGVFRVLGRIEDGQINFKLPDKYAINGIYRKPYAACRHSHSAIEAALIIKNKNNISIDEIEEVRIKTYRAAVFGHDHHEIFGAGSAKMSIPYSVAVALYTGGAGIEKFEGPYLENDLVRSLINRIRVVEDEGLTKQAPAKRAAIVEILTKDGCRSSETVEYPKGEPENPMSREDIEAKFYSMAEYANININKIKDVIDKIWNF